MACYGDLLCLTLLYMDEVGKGYHCVWQIHYHVVFPVKYRKALLDEEVVGIIMETEPGISGRYAIEMESIGCDRDHIHLLCSANWDTVEPHVKNQGHKGNTLRQLKLF